MARVGIAFLQNITDQALFETTVRIHRDGVMNMRIKPLPYGRNAMYAVLRKGVPLHTENHRQPVTVRAISRCLHGVKRLF